jgi:hypothetical protein
MVIFLVTKLHDYTLREVLAAPGSIAVVHYADAFATRRPPHATYVFSDLDRLNSIGIERAADLYRQFMRAGCRALNDPARFVGRLALLRRLYAVGINPFTAYPAVPKPLPERWPVFLRLDAGHRPPLTGLLADPSELARETAAALDVGVSPEQLIVVEFSAEPLACGI